jgi:FxsC-like protein
VVSIGIGCETTAICAGIPTARCSPYIARGGSGVVGERSGRANDPPYFFLSYHRSDFRPADGSDPDSAVRRFFAGLCKDVAQFAASSNPGVMDRQSPVGSPWRDKLAEALACCKVFVPLLSPGYFNSEFCGREWTVFSRRMRMHAATGHSEPAIVPVLWTRLQAEDLPPQVSRLNLTSSGFPPAYEQQGMFVLMRLQRYSGAYTKSVLKVAQTIWEVGEAAKLAPCDPIEIDSVENAFADYQANNTRYRVRVIVAACSIGLVSGELSVSHYDPKFRLSYYYGRKMREWNPYRNLTTVTPITSFAEDVISGLNHRPVVQALDEPTASPVPMPSVVLLDPWAAGVPEIANKLREIDYHRPHVVVPWNEEDEETAREAERLEQNLRQAMPNSLALNGSAPRVPTIEAFRAALPKAVYEAISRHFMTAPAYPPSEDASMDRLPTLGGPVA